MASLLENVVFIVEREGGEIIKLLFGVTAQWLIL